MSLPAEMFAAFWMTTKMLLICIAAFAPPLLFAWAVSAFAIWTLRPKRRPEDRP